MTRKTCKLVLGISIVVAVVRAALPLTDLQLTTIQTHLDDTLSKGDFDSLHSISESIQLLDLCFSAENSKRSNSLSHIVSKIEQMAS